MGSKSLRRKPAWEPEGAKAPVAEEAPEAAGAPRVPGALEALQGAWGKAGSWARRRLARAAARCQCGIGARLRDVKGQGTTEYAILVGVLVVIAIIAITLFRPKIQELWDAIATGINGL